MGNNLDEVFQKVSVSQIHLCQKTTEQAPTTDREESPS
jgi:hypothetical protein